MKLGQKVILLSTLMGILICFVNALLDYIFFYQGTFMGLLILDVPHHALYMRASILVSFILFGTAIARVITQQNVAERELKKFKAITDSANFGVMLSEISGKILYANEYIAKLHGYTPEGLKGKNPLTLYGDTHKELIRELCNTAKKMPEGIKNREILHRHQNGSIFPMLMNLSVIKDELGIPLFMATTGIDVTQINKTKEELHYRMRFENLIAEISTRFINTPPSETDRHIYQALKDIGEFVGVDRSYLCLFSEDQTQITNINEWRSQGIPPSIQDCQSIPAEEFPWAVKRIKRGDNINILHIGDLPEEAHRDKVNWEREDIRSLVMVPIQGSDSIMGFLGFDSVREEKAWDRDAISLLKMVGNMFANVLERKRYMQRIKQKQQLFRKTLNCIRDAVFILDCCAPIAKIQNCNSAAVEIFGYTKDEMIGRTTEFLHVDNASLSRFREQVKQAMQETGHLKEFDFIMRRKNGEVFPSRHSVMPISDEQSKQIGWVSVVSDLKRYEKINQDRDVSALQKNDTTK